MKIKVIDSFGAHVGDADVIWKEVTFSPPYDSMQDQVDEIFPDPKFIVLVPTRNAAMPWRFEIER